MNYLRFAFKTSNKKKLTVTVEKTVKILVLTDKNFKRYKNGNKCVFFGEMATGEPFEITLPGKQIYHVVIELKNFTKEEVNPKINLESVEATVNTDIAELEEILSREEE